MSSSVGDLLHNKDVREVLHFDNLHLGESGPLLDAGVAGGGYRYLLVVIYNVTVYVRLEPVLACTRK